MLVKKLFMIVTCVCLATVMIALPVCASADITMQPSAENGYTVAADGEVLQYNWHTYFEGEPEAITSANAVVADSGASCSDDGVWTASAGNIGFYFKVALDRDDVLTVELSSTENVEMVVVADRTKGIRFENNDGVYVIGVKGNYELMIKIKEGSVAPTAKATFKKIDIGEPIEGQHAATLDTDDLKSGSYIASVCFSDNRGIVYSEPFSYIEPPYTGDAKMIFPVMIALVSAAAFSASFSRRKRVSE